MLKKKQHHGFSKEACNNGERKKKKNKFEKDITKWIKGKKMDKTCYLKENSKNKCNGDFPEAL